MPITLQQAKVGMAKKVDQQVIDVFRRESFLMDRLVYDDAVSPGTGGSTLVYGYQQIQTPATAGFRAINSEYAPQETTRVEKTVTLAVLGGAFQIDRVIQNTSGQINETQFQLEQKIIAARNQFHNTVINGDSAVVPNSFDGLNKFLTGTSTELNTSAVIDLSTLTDSNKFLILDEIDKFLSALMRRPDMLICNSKLSNRIKASARRAGYLTHSEDAFGRGVDAYDDIPIIDAGYFTDGSGTETPIIPVVTRTVGSEQQGLTDLYAVYIGMDGFHGVTPMGGVGIQTYLPDFKAPGAVKKGEVEMVVGVALKNTRAAGVLRNIKVQ